MVGGMMILEEATGKRKRKRSRVLWTCHGLSGSRPKRDG